MNRNDKLDEMQVQRKNKIGSSCFMIMFYLLFIDIGLHEMGIRWMAYPINVLIIISICMAYYLIKIIWTGSYLGVSIKNQNSRHVIGGIIASVILLISGIIISILFRENTNILSNIGNTIILIALFILTILVIISLGNISRRKSDSGED